MRIQYNKLWKILIDKNMKKVDLRDAAEISSNSIAKLGKNDTVTLNMRFKLKENRWEKD